MHPRRFLYRLLPNCIVQTRDERPSISYAAMIMKYLEANSLANVLARVDLCTSIKSIPSTIQ